MKSMQWYFLFIFVTSTYITKFSIYFILIFFCFSAIFCFTNPDYLLILIREDLFYVKVKEIVKVTNTDIELIGQSFWRVDAFKCLGSTITSQNEIEYEKKDKISAANRCFLALNKILSKTYRKK